MLRVKVCTTMPGSYYVYVCMSVWEYVLPRCWQRPEDSVGCSGAGVSDGAAPSRGCGRELAPLQEQEVLVTTEPCLACVVCFTCIKKARSTSQRKIFYFFWSPSLLINFVYDKQCHRINESGNKVKASSKWLFLNVLFINLWPFQIYSPHIDYVLFF